MRILSFDAAGRPLKAKRLSSEKLRVQKRLADIELVLSRLRDVKPGDAEKPLAPVRKEFQRLDGFEKTLEAAWDKVDDWENVPVKP